MPSGQVHWTLVFTAASLGHLAERNVEAAEVMGAVYGRYGPARVRRAGRGARERWFVVAPLEDGELLTCVFRAVLGRDLNAAGAFVLTAAGSREPVPRQNLIRLAQEHRDPSLRPRAQDPEPS